MAYWHRAEHMDTERRAEFDAILARTAADWDALAEAEAAADVEARRRKVEELAMLGDVG